MLLCGSSTIKLGRKLSSKGYLMLVFQRNIFEVKSKGTEVIVVYLQMGIKQDKFLNLQMQKRPRPTT